MRYIHVYLVDDGRGRDLGGGRAQTTPAAVRGGTRRPPTTLRFVIAQATQNAVLFLADVLVFVLDFGGDYFAASRLGLAAALLLLLLLILLLFE